MTAPTPPPLPTALATALRNTADRILNQHQETRR